MHFELFKDSLAAIRARYSEGMDREQYFAFMQHFVDLYQLSEEQVGAIYEILDKNRVRAAHPAAAHRSRRDREAARHARR